MKLLKFLKLSTVILVLNFVFTASGVASPNPYLAGVSYGGTGCPSGSADVILTNSALLFLFDNFLVEAAPGVSRFESRKFCQAIIDIKVPSGWQYALTGVNLSGYSDMDHEAYGRGTIDVGFSGVSSLQRNKFSFRTRSGSSNDFHVDLNISNSNLTWSPCGVNRALNVKTGLDVRAKRGSSGLMVVGGAAGTKYDLKWRRCR